MSGKVSLVLHTIRYFLFIAISPTVGIDSLHQLGFSHTDIKMSNIFVDQNGYDAFIDDLEYLTAVNGPPRSDAPGSASESARGQDMFQLEIFATAVNCF